MSGFQHDIAGGNGDLVVTSVQSPNFVSGSAGWQIAKDGSAEFNDLVIRGTFKGTDFELNSNGLFFYNGTPAAGNLILSIASAAGTDEFGNSYLAGFTSTNLSGGEPQVNLFTGGISFINKTSPGTAPCSVDGTCTSSVAELDISSGQISNSSVNSQISLLDGITGGVGGGVVGLIDTQGALRNDTALYLVESLTTTPPSTGATEAVLYCDSNGILRVMNNSGAGGVPAITRADTTQHTNANNGTQLISTAWTIPADDLQVGTIYMVETLFTGTFENQTLTWNSRFDSTDRAGVTIGSGFFTSGTGFNGYIRVYVQCLSTGSNGTAVQWCEGGVGVAGTRSSGTNNNNAFLSSNLSVTFTVDTTASHTIAASAGWGGSTAGQTITGNGSKVTRSGA